MLLSYFQKPSRYIGTEYNTIVKVLPEKGSVRFALCFPDVYEVGMSHLGLRILHHIINRLPYASAERVFAPWPDFDHYLQQHSRPLASLETRTPLNRFDIAGFSLQYELSYTTVLSMLDRGGIPIYAAERRGLPLVVAGGPCTVNPAPVAAFFDAILIGDGEEAVVELAEVVRNWKTEGDGRRESLLEAVSALEGFYVPAFGNPVRRRIVSDLDAAPFPVRPVVPCMEIVHDRITIEIARGCAQGCRFCQAGMIYRPLRQRSPERILEIARESLSNTGYDEVSFSSLSAGDYPYLLPLIREFNRRFGDRKIAVSLPSLRVGAVDRDVLREIVSIRRTGFTIAPEAATERLRNVINKDLTGDDFDRALGHLFTEGWQNLKLYFMIGLPTETGEDVEAIAAMVGKARKTARKLSSRPVTISVTISPFIAKAHTPFQWEGQENPEVIREKLLHLRRAISSRHVTYKGHNENMSILEAAFARADGNASPLIAEAWRSGCRLDGWTEHFNFAKWTEAMERTGIDGYALAGKRYEPDDVLPWNCVDSGISKEFLVRERERAYRAERTPCCTEACRACGLSCENPGTEKPGIVITTKTEPSEPERKHKEDRKVIRIRAMFSRTGEMRWLSHLETAELLVRAIRRTDIPVDFSRGFNPVPLVSFGPSLNVGMEGEREFFDMDVFIPFDCLLFTGALNAVLPEGFHIPAMQPVSRNEPSLSSFITRYACTIRFQGRGDERFPGIAETGQNGSSGRMVPVSPLASERDGRMVDLSGCVESVEEIERPNGEGTWVIRGMFRDQENIKLRLSEILRTLFGRETKDMLITRNALYGQRNGWSEPL